MINTRCPECNRRVSNQGRKGHESERAFTIREGRCRLCAAERKRRERGRCQRCRRAVAETDYEAWVSSGRRPLACPDHAGQP